MHSVHGSHAIECLESELLAPYLKTQEDALPRCVLRSEGGSPASLPLRTTEQSARLSPLTGRSFISGASPSRSMLYPVSPLSVKGALAMADASLVIPAPLPAVLPVIGTTAQFPIRRVFCVGRNYAAHAREMGHSDREPPFFFTKPADAVFTPHDGVVPYPSATKDLHHEVELVVALKSGGANIAVQDALSHVYGCAVGVDLTRRDLQAEAKKAARPWDMAKGFDASGPVGPLLPMANEGELPQQAAITLTIDGQVRQNGSTQDMIWSVAEVISALSELVTLAAGDVIFTGTPEGVGPLCPGESVQAVVAGLPPLSFTVKA